MITNNPFILDSIGKTIQSICIDTSDKILIEFTDGSKISIADEYSCCEARYFVCADDLSSFIGETIVSFDVKEAPDIETEDDVHEVMFFEIRTNKSTITFACHNEHNGYYGGFDLYVSGFKPSVWSEQGNPIVNKQEADFDYAGRVSFRDSTYPSPLLIK